MKQDISTLVGVLIIVTISVIFGFIIIRQGQSVSDTVEQAPDTLKNLDTLRDQLNDREPGPEVPGP